MMSCTRFVRPNPNKSAVALRRHDLMTTIRAPRRLRALDETQVGEAAGSKWAPRRRIARRLLIMVTWCPRTPAATAQCCHSAPSLPGAIPTHCMQRQRAAQALFAANALTHSSNVATASSTSFSETMSGGTKRTTFGPAGTRRRPRAAAAPHTSAAVAGKLSESTTPRMRPQPRTCVTASAVSLATRSSPARSCAPLAFTLSRMFARSISASTALPAAVARKLPPYVVACSPGMKTLASSLQSMAPMGTPPPRALAQLSTSGCTPSCSCAQKVPVRPTPT
mmetsp:Transcript_4167/g.11800  ORF Transcript_4167/g.11800 Transcript_4167/m.11800 type:complete len:280 (+) Transcript_4167:725-1564(+)